MKIKKGFIVRSVGGEKIAVPVGEEAKKFHGMIKLNETADFLWGFFKTEHTEEEAVTALLKNYEVDEETAKKDVAAFLGVLTENGSSNEPFHRRSAFDRRKIRRSHIRREYAPHVKNGARRQRSYSGSRRKRSTAAPFRRPL